MHGPPTSTRAGSSGNNYHYTVDAPVSLLLLFLLLSSVSTKLGMMRPLRSHNGIPLFCRELDEMSLAHPTTLKGQYEAIPDPNHVKI